MDEHPSLWDQDMQKDISIFLQIPEADFTIFQVQAHKALRVPSNQEADALAQVSDSSVETADWAHKRKGHHSAWRRLQIAKDAR